MNTFWSSRQKIPKHIRIFQVSLWVSFLCMNKIGKLTWVSYKKHRRIITYKIPISFFSIKLNSKASRISFRVSRSSLSANCWESYKYWCLFSNLTQKICFAKSGYIICYSKNPMCSSTFGVNNSFRNSLSIKASYFINKLYIL